MDQQISGVQTAERDEGPAGAVPESRQQHRRDQADRASLPAAFSASGPVSRDDLAADATPALFAKGATELADSEARDTKVVSRPVSRPDASETSTPAIDLSETENPLLTEESVGRTMPLSTVSRVWGVGAFMLFTVLLAQTAFAFRTLLVASYPELRPPASQICELAGCTLSWGRDETALKIEASELIEAPGKLGRILLTAILVNRGKTKQDLPSLELRLTDNANQVIVSRLLHPRDYLGRAIAKDDRCDVAGECRCVRGDRRAHQQA